MVTPGLNSVCRFQWTATETDYNKNPLLSHAELTNEPSTQIDVPIDPRIIGTHNAQSSNSAVDWIEFS